MVKYFSMWPDLSLIMTIQDLLVLGVKDLREEEKTYFCRGFMRSR